jgi:hypothetical protein
MDLFEAWIDTPVTIVKVRITASCNHAAYELACAQYGKERVLCVMGVYE